MKPPFIFQDAWISKYDLFYKSGWLKHKDFVTGTICVGILELGVFKRRGLTSPSSQLSIFTQTQNRGANVRSSSATSEPLQRSLLEEHVCVESQAVPVKYRRKWNHKPAHLLQPVNQRDHLGAYTHIWCSPKRSVGVHRDAHVPHEGRMPNCVRKPE